MAYIQPFPPNTRILAAKLSVSERTLIARFMDERGFQNPLAPLINQVREQAAGAASTLTAAALLPEPIPGYDPLTAAQLTALAAACTALATACTNYKTHSDRLTGVTFDDSADPPDLAGLLAIASGYNSAKESMRDPDSVRDPVDNFSPIFYSLVSGEAESALTKATDALSMIRQLSTGNRTGVYAIIMGAVTYASARLSALVSLDNANYTTARTYLRKYGNAMSLNAAFANEDWAFFYADSNVADLTTKGLIETIRTERGLTGPLTPSTYSGTAAQLRVET